MKTENKNPLEIVESHNNKKLNGIRSVSLPPVITCRPDAPCKRDCYACKMARLYKKNLMQSWQKNYSIYNAAPDLFFEQLRIKFLMQKYYRLNVSGDIPSADYFERLTKAATGTGCKIILFTKQFEIVNNFINAGGVIPENLIVIFSGWSSWQPENPHRLPMAQVVFKGEEPRDGWKPCPNNCELCATTCGGCFNLKAGETVYFWKH